MCRNLWVIRLCLTQILGTWNSSLESRDGFLSSVCNVKSTWPLTASAKINDLYTVYGVYILVFGFRSISIQILSLLTLSKKLTTLFIVLRNVHHSGILQMLPCCKSDFMQKYMCNHYFRQKIK